MGRLTKVSNLFSVNVITGMSDGLVLPLAAGIIAYAHANGNELARIVWLVTLAGGLAYGLARYFGEREEIRHNHPQIAQHEAEAELAMMNAIGIDQQLSLDVQAQMEQERAQWLDEVEQNEMGWNHDDKGRALRSGIQTASGFCVGAVIVCQPILLFRLSMVSGGVWTLFVYLLFVLLRARLTHDRRRASLLGFMLKGISIIGLAACIGWMSRGMGL